MYVGRKIKSAIKKMREREKWALVAALQSVRYVFGLVTLLSCSLPRAPVCFELSCCALLIPAGVRHKENVVLSTKTIFFDCWN